MFRITLNKGFHMTFANGLTASVQWGTGNYCDNHFSNDFTFSNPAESRTAEVAVWDENGKWFDPAEFMECDSDGMVCGWLTPEQVAVFLSMVAAYKKED